jgi:glycosyl transferase family 2
VKLVMTLLVRDEEDIVEDHLVYHLNQGVDFVVATDNNSVDGTRDVLDRFQRMGYVEVIDEPDDTYDQWRWVTRMARRAATDRGADWVINSDADEFWWPKTGNLRSVLDAVPTRYGVLSAPRVNLVPPPDAPSPGLAQRWFERMALRETRSLNGLGAPLPPKVCHRADADVVVEQGNHELRGSALAVAPGLQPIVIFHAPLRSWPQLENKVVKGGAAYARNRELPGAVGDAWRSLYDLHAQGGLRGWYDAQVPDDRARRQGVEEGRFILDRRLAHFLATRARREPPFCDSSPAPAIVVDHALDRAVVDRAAVGPRGKAQVRSVARVSRRWLGRVRGLRARG